MFLKFLIHPVSVKGRTGEQLVQVVGEGVSHLALHPAAGIDCPVGEDGQVTVAAVAAVVDVLVVRAGLGVKESLLIQVQRPKVVL